MKSFVCTKPIQNEPNQTKEIRTRTQNQQWTTHKEYLTIQIYKTNIVWNKTQMNTWIKLNKINIQTDKANT